MQALVERESLSEKEPAKEALPEFKYTRAFDALGLISRELLGAKGAMLAEMASLGFRVPPGFTLTTEAWQQFHEKGGLPEEIWQEFKTQLNLLGEKTGREFGNPQKPLFVSLRPGAPWSMPGMMETLFVGLNQESLEGLAQIIMQKHHLPYLVALDCAEDSYYRAQKEFKRVTGEELPENPWEQLKRGLKAVFNSYDSPKAREFRKFAWIPDEAGTGLSVQMVVHGNLLDGQSGAGVFFTRNPISGENEIYSEFVVGGQGSEVVTPTKRPGKLPERLLPKAKSYKNALETYYGAPQDVEFTEEGGEFWLLQSRELELSNPLAEIRVAIEMTEEGIITQEEAAEKITFFLPFLYRATFDPEAVALAQEQGRLFSWGTPASFGDAVGRIAFNLSEARELQEQGERAILFCPYLDRAGISPFEGLVTTLGGTTSHPVVTLSKQEIPVIVGADLKIDPESGTIAASGQTLHRGEVVSISGTTGEIFRGEVPLLKATTLPDWLEKYLKEHEIKVSEASSWNQFLSSRRDKEHFQRELGKISSFLRQWQSDKAITNIILSFLSPPEAIIPRMVIKAYDEETIQTALKRVLAAGGENAPRSCFSNGRVETPYFIGPNTPEEIERFLTDPELGGFAAWKKDPDFEGVIVSQEPPGKLDRQLAKKHFAFSIRCHDHQVSVELILGTPHIREVKTVDPERLIRITAQLNRGSPSCLGKVEVEFGQAYRGDPYAEKVAEIVRKKVFQDWWRFLPGLGVVLEEFHQIKILEGQGRMEDDQEKWVLLYDGKT